MLRHLLDDHPELSPKAQDLLDRNDVELRYEVMCEIVYVLSKLYGVPRARIEADLRAFIAADSVYIQDEETACEALQLYRDQNIDIVDAILCAHAKVRGRGILTFDAKMLKVLTRESANGQNT